MLTNTTTINASLYPNHLSSELAHSDTHEFIRDAEQCIETYRRDVCAGEAISQSDIVMLQIVREQLAQLLKEQLRFDDETIRFATAEQAAYTDKLMHLVQRMDQLLPVLEQSLHFTRYE